LSPPRASAIFGRSPGRLIYPWHSSARRKGVSIALENFRTRVIVEFGVSEVNTSISDTLRSAKFALITLWAGTKWLASHHKPRYRYRNYFELAGEGDAVLSTPESTATVGQAR
jgi:hypothetical protein